MRATLPFRLRRSLSTAAASLPPQTPLTLYGRTSSFNTQKVLFALEKTGVPFTLVPASARVGAGSELLCNQRSDGGAPFGHVGTEE